MTQSQPPPALDNDEREVLLATIRELVEHSRVFTFDADDAENEAWKRAESVLASLHTRYLT